MTTNDKLSATSTTTDNQETAMNADQTDNSVPQPETENIVTSGNVIGEDIASSDDTGFDQRADLPAENADDAEGMAADEIEAALPGKQSCMDAASACEEAASAVYDADGRVASGEKEVRRRIYVALAQAFAFYLAYRGTPDYDNYISSQGVDPDPKQAGKFNPLLKAVFGLGKKGTIKASEALKGRMRTRLSKMTASLELAELRAKLDANGNIDIVAFLEGKVDVEGRSGMEAARAEMARIRRVEKSPDISKFDAGLEKLLAEGSTTLPAPQDIGSHPTLLAVHTVDGQLVFLGQVTGDNADKLLKRFIEAGGDAGGSGTLPDTAMGELVGYLSFARALGAVDYKIRIEVTDNGVQVQVAQETTETVIGQCFIARPSLLPSGTYWLDKKTATQISSISRFAKHGARFEVHPPKVLSDRTVATVSAFGIQTAVDAYNAERREKNPVEYREFSLDKILDILESQNAQRTDRAEVPCELQMPTIAEEANPQNWLELAEAVIDDDARTWVSKTMNTSGQSEVAKAVHAGTEGNLVNLRISNDGFHVLNGLGDAVVVSHQFEPPINSEPFEATYCFCAKDLPGALSAVKGVLPDAPVILSVSFKAVRLRAEQDGTVAEFLIPTLVNGTRYPKAAKLTGFVIADEPDEGQDAA